MQCPSCHSEKVIKNGRIHNHTPKFACKACGRQFVENPQNRISEDKKALIDKLYIGKNFTSRYRSGGWGFRALATKLCESRISRDALTGAGKNPKGGVFVGDRSRPGAQRLWESLPAVYRHCGVGYPDFWEAYLGVLPTRRYRAVGKQTGKIYKIERFNATFKTTCISLRQKNPVIFKKARKPHRRYLVFCSP